MGTLTIKDFSLFCKTNNLRAIQNKLDCLIMTSKLAGYKVEIVQMGNSDIELRIIEIINIGPLEGLPKYMCIINFIPFLQNQTILSHLSISSFVSNFNRQNCSLDDFENELDGIINLL